MTNYDDHLKEMEKDPEFRMHYALQGRNTIVRNNLRQILKDKGLTQIALAEYVGLSRAAVHQFVNQLNNPSLQIALAISKVLEKPIEEIFYLEYIYKSKYTNEYD